MRKKRTHLHAKIDSLQGRPLDKFGRDKSREINVKLAELEIISCNALFVIILKKASITYVCY